MLLFWNWRSTCGGLGTTPQTSFGFNSTRNFGNPRFQQKLEDLIGEKRDRERSPRWFQQVHSGVPLTTVAYFSLEFLLSEALPIYSGGLGNVAGDQLKAASDLGVPVTGVGLLYQQGYFRQLIDAQGRQQALYPFNDPGQLPIQPVRDEMGEWVRVPHSTSRVQTLDSCLGSAGRAHEALPPR